MRDINPSDYVKLFNIRETPIITYYEIMKRRTLTEDEGFPNVEMIYFSNQHYFSKKDIEKYDFELSKIREIINLVEKRSRNLVEFSRDNDDIENFFEKFGKFMAVVDLPIYIYNNFEKRFVCALEEEGLIDKFNVLTHPFYNSFHFRRKVDLISLREEEMTRDEFKKKWGFSEMQLFEKKFVDDNFIDEQLEHVKDNLSETQEKNRKIKLEYEEILIRHSKIKDYVEISQELIRIRDVRFECFIKTVYNSLPLLEKRAKELNVDYDDLIYMTPPEIINGVVSFDIDKRKEDFAFVDDITTDKEIINKLNQLFNKRLEQKEVCGKGVSSGVVRGRAKIVLCKRDLVKIEKDDIIVCDITTPDYMHALHKVLAIVANIGGFTSHSAIVAREFHIPCVVGCSIATRVFKDGDLIEVDADKGIVKKL